MTVDEWRRFHPATPVVKGWQPLVAVVALGAQDGFGGERLVFLSVLTPAVMVVSAFGFYLNWRASRYRVEGADLVVETGVINKRSRRVPLARIQAIDIVKPLLARAIGLAELRLEVAGGRQSNASLAYLDDATAGVVRNDLLALAAGLRDDLTVVPAPPEPAEDLLTATPTGRLIVATIISSAWNLLVIALAVVVVVLLVFAGRGDAGIAGLGALISLVLSIGGQLWKTFSTEFGSVLADSPDGLRIRRGLLETRSQTVPPGRVQGVLIKEPLAWRLFGWARLTATVAGYDTAGTLGGSGTAVLLPVAPVDEARAVVDRVLPGVDWSRVALEPAPARARWRAPIEHRRLGVGVGDEGADRVLVTRRGRFGTRTDIVPLARLQSVRIDQGPLQRRLRLANVYADLSTGPVLAVGLHRDEHEARALLDQLVAEARSARVAARPERWMRDLRSAG